MDMTAPNQLFGELVELARPQKQRNLEIVHQICSELHRLGSKNFSIATIGQMSQDRGGMSKQAFYNSTSSDFKALIHSWSTFSTKKVSEPKSRENLLSDYTLLRKIPDAALRSMIGNVIAERDRLRGEVKALKKNANIVIDKRVLPGFVNVTPEGQIIQVLDAVAGLSEMEREALRKAISHDFFKQEGWSEGPNGEILNAHGRLLFDIGFINAIKKILT